MTDRCPCTQFQSLVLLPTAHERLQQTCRDCLELTGTKLEAGITSDALARQLQLRWLQLIKAAESMAAKGKGYKAQAKHEAERAEKAITAGRELQVQLRAAHQRIAELQAVAQAREHVIVSGTSSGEVRGVGNDGDSLCAAAVTPCSASAHVESLLGELTPHPATPSQQPPRERHGDDGQNGEVRGGGGGSAGSLVASTPAFLHEAEFDLKMQLSSPEMLAAAAADMTGLAASEAEGGSAGCRPLSVRIVPATGDRVQLSLEP